MVRLALGEREYDVTYRALVMGILNRTPDSFYDAGRVLRVRRLPAPRPTRLVADGADLLDVGGVKAGPGPEVSEDEELERVVPAVEALRAASTSRSPSTPGGPRCCRRPARPARSIGNDISGFADPDYLAVAAAHGAAVVATHIRLAPAGARSRAHLRRRRGGGGRVPAPSARRRARAAGIPRQRIMVDAGLDLGKTEPHVPRAAADLRPARRPRVPGAPVGVQQALPRRAARLGRRRAPAAPRVAAHALGIALGCRVLRAHDVRGTRRVADVLAAVLEARAARGAGRAADG